LKKSKQSPHSAAINEFKDSVSEQILQLALKQFSTNNDVEIITPKIPFLEAHANGRIPLALLTLFGDTYTQLLLTYGVAFRHIRDRTHDYYAANLLDTNRNARVAIDNSALVPLSQLDQSSRQILLDKFVEVVSNANAEADAKVMQQILAQCSTPFPSLPGIRRPGHPISNI